MSQILIVVKNVINIYDKPVASSEVTTQAILGARLKEEERSGNFVRVVSKDLYSGWASAGFLVPDEEAPYTVSDNTMNSPMVTDLFAGVYSAPDESSELVSRLVVSTRLCAVTYTRDTEPTESQSKGYRYSPKRVMQAGSGARNATAASEFSEFMNIRMPGGTSGWVKRSRIGKPSAVSDISNWDKSTEQREVLIKMLGERVVVTAKRFIGVPYLWGGCTPFGIDCSGFTQLCYKIEGIQLLRDTRLQEVDKRFIEVESGKAFNDAQFLPGDIVVFGTENNRGAGPRHIGIACGGGHFIHSSGRERNFGVYIDSCCEPFYVERYMKALRLSPSTELSIDNALTEKIM